MRLFKLALNGETLYASTDRKEFRSRMVTIVEDMGYEPADSLEALDTLLDLGYHYDILEI